MTPPDSTPEQLRFPVRPEARPFVEVLTWWFPANRPTGATLAMQWGTTYVPLEVEVTPSHPLTVSANDAAPYLGSYEFRWIAPSGGELPPGIAISGKPVSPDPVTFTVTHEAGHLVGRWNPAPDAEMAAIVLVPLAKDWFLTGFLDEKGAVRDLEIEMVFEFAVAQGRATSLELRGLGDALMGTGKRKG